MVEDVGFAAPTPTGPRTSATPADPGTDIGTNGDAPYAPAFAPQDPGPDLDAVTFGPRMPFPALYSQHSLHLGFDHFDIQRLPR